MASSKEYLEFVLEQLSELDEVTHRAMMLLVENIDDRAFLRELFDAMLPELPALKKRKKKTI